MINKHSLKTDYKKNTILPKFLRKVGQLLLQDMNSIDGSERKKLSFFKGIRLPIVIEKIGNFVLAKLPESFLEPFSEYLYHKTGSLRNLINEIYQLNEKKAGTDYTHIFDDENSIKVTSTLGLASPDSSIPTTILNLDFDEIKIEDKYPYLIIKSEKISEFINQKNIYSEKGGIILAPLVESDFEIINKVFNFGRLMIKLSQLKEEAKNLIKKAATASSRNPPPRPQLGMPDTNVVGGQTQISEAEEAFRILNQLFQVIAPFLGLAQVGVPQAPRFLYLAVWRELRKQWPEMVSQDATFLFNAIKNIGAVFGFNVDPSLKDKIAKSLEEGAWATYYPMLASFLGVTTPNSIGVALTNAFYNWIVSLDPTALDSENAPELANRIAIITRHVTADIFPLLQKYQLVSLTPNQFVEYVVTLTSFMPEKLPDPRSTDPETAARVYSSLIKRHIPLIYLAASRGIKPDQLAKFIDQAGLRGADPLDIAVALGHAFGMGGVTGQGLAAIANSGPFRQLMHLKMAVRNNPELMNNPYVAQALAYYEMGGIIGGGMAMGMAPFPPPILLSMALSSIGINPIIAANTPVPASELIKELPYMKRLTPYLMASMADLSLPGTGGVILGLLNTIHLDPELRQKIRNTGNYVDVFYEAGRKMGLPPSYVQAAISGVGHAASRLNTSPENFLYMIMTSVGPRALTNEETLRRIYFELAGRPRRGAMANLAQALLTENIDPNAPFLEKIWRIVPYILGYYPLELSQLPKPEEFIKDIGAGNIIFPQYYRSDLNTDKSTTRKANV